MYEYDTLYIYKAVCQVCQNRSKFTMFFANIHILGYNYLILRSFRFERRLKVAYVDETRQEQPQRYVCGHIGHGRRTIGALIFIKTPQMMIIEGNVELREGFGGVYCKMKKCTYRSIMLCARLHSSYMLRICTNMMHYTFIKRSVRSVKIDRNSQFFCKYS